MRKLIVVLSVLAVVGLVLLALSAVVDAEALRHSV